MFTSGQITGKRPESLVIIKFVDILSLVPGGAITITCHIFTEIVFAERHSLQHLAYVCHVKTLYLGYGHAESIIRI